MCAQQNPTTSFAVNTVSMAEMRRTLLEVRDYFQGKVGTLAALETVLGDTFFGGHAGETGAFQRQYQSFGREWVAQWGKLLVLEQRFVDLIDEQGEAVRKAAAMYTHADDTARAKLQSILADLA